MKLALLALTAALAASPFSAAQSPSDKAAQQRATPPSQQPAPDPFAGVPAAKPDDVKSVDSLLAALYEVISGPAGERDWKRFRSLFMPNARLTSAERSPDGVIHVRPSSVEDYVRLARHGYFLEERSFFEKPIVSRVQTFGNVAQIFSSYESRHALGEAPFARGINSLQMLYDGKRWWVVNILWDEERPDNPLPQGICKQTLKRLKSAALIHRANSPFRLSLQASAHLL